LKPIKVKAVLLYLAILSYCGIMYVLGFVPASHEAVRLWVKKVECFNLNVAAKEAPIGYNLCG
jgi:hypothetical protein